MAKMKIPVIYGKCYATIKNDTFAFKYYAYVKLRSVGGDGLNPSGKWIHSCTLQIYIYICIMYNVYIQYVHVHIVRSVAFD